MKTIMIIGAGNAQIPLIIAAKKGNYNTVVCDLNPDAPGIPLADGYCRVSTRDRVGLLEAAKKKHINGIVANSDYAMRDVAFISERLGLVGNPEKGVAILSSKSRFREMQEKNGLFSPKFIAADASEQICVEGLSFPVVVKPDESSGSRGVAVITDCDASEIRSGLKAALAASRNGKAIIEEYVSMPSRTVIEGEIFIHKGEILWDGLFQTIRSKAAPMLPMTYVFPVSENEEKISKAKEALAKAFHSAGIVHGEYNIELYPTETGEPFIIEINPRQGGYDLPRYVWKHCGIDYYRLLVTTSMGDDDYWDSLKMFERKKQNIIHHMLFPRSSGQFIGVQVADALKNRVVDIRLDERTGTEIAGTVDASSCIGCVDLRFADAGELQRVAYELEDQIKVEVRQVQSDN